MKVFLPRATVSCLIAGLTLFVCNASAGSKPNAARVVGATTTDEFGTYELCVAYPQPEGYHWSRGIIEAFCADEFTQALTLRHIRDRIDAGEGKLLDAEYDKILAEYFAGHLPEGTARYAYKRFDSADQATGEIINRWLKQSPASAHARAARGIHRVSRAYAARGSAWAKDTPRENFRRMDEELLRAKPDLMDAISANGRILAAYEWLVDLAQLQSDGDLGAWAATRALRVDPKNFYVRAAWSQMWKPRWGGSLKKMDEIADSTQRWLAANPRLASLRAMALAERATAINGDNNLDRQLQEYVRGLAVAPMYEPLNRAASNADKLNRHAQAVIFCSQMLRFWPYHSYARHQRARSYLALQNYPAAQKDLEISLAVDPDDAYALRNYGRLLMLQKDFKAAAVKLEHAYAQDSNDVWTQQQLAWVYVYNKRDFKAAEPLVAQLLGRDPKSGAAWLMRADIIQNLGGPGLKEAAENFVRYADTSIEEQRVALPKVKAWLANQAES